MTQPPYDCILYLSPETQLIVKELQFCGFSIMARDSSLCQLALSNGVIALGLSFSITPFGDRERGGWFVDCIHAYSNQSGMTEVHNTSAEALQEAVDWWRTWEDQNSRLKRS